MGKLFGTDGVRGLANADLTPELALALGRAAVGVLLAEGSGQGSGAPARPAVLVGRDPRASGTLLESALVAGILSAGGDVLAAGVVPTPAVAFLTRDAREVERKKYGLKKARKAPQYSKR